MLPQYGHTINLGMLDTLSVIVMLASARSIGVFRASRDPLLDKRNFFFGQKLAPRRHHTIVICGEFDSFDQQTSRWITGKDGPPVFFTFGECFGNGFQTKSTFFLLWTVAGNASGFQNGFDLREEMNFFRSRL